MNKKEKEQVIKMLDSISNQYARELSLCYDTALSLKMLLMTACGMSEKKADSAIEDLTAIVSKNFVEDERYKLFQRFLNKEITGDELLLLDVELGLKTKGDYDSEAFEKALDILFGGRR